MNNKNKDIAIIGSGVTGLTAGYRLKKNGFNVTVFEKNSKPGGAIKSVQQEGYLTEYGPNTLLLKDRLIADFFDELDLTVKMKEANPDASNRFIVKNGKLLPLPGSMIDAIKTPLFSFPAKLRVVIEPMITKSDDPDQTVADFVERRLGKEILDYAINPFVAGIFANKPDSLSLRHAFPVMHDMEQDYGSLIAGAIFGAKNRRNSGRIERKLISFEEGLQILPDRLASDLEIRFHSRVTSIERKGDGWYVDCSGEYAGPYNQLILNVPLYLMGEIQTPFQKQMEAINRKVYYPRLSVIHIAAEKRSIAHELNGFGFLVPEKENRNILGALFSSTLFEGRVPADQHLLTVFVGGGRQPDLAGLKSEQLFDLVIEELRGLIGLDGDPVFKDHVYWPKSIPAYHVGYDEIENRIMEIEQSNDGLHIAGNFRYGISVPDCIRNGLNYAELIMEEASA